MDYAPEAIEHTLLSGDEATIQNHRQTMLFAPWAAPEGRYEKVVSIKK